MRRHIAWVGAWILGVGLLLLDRPAEAVIIRLTPLREVVGAKDQLIFVTRVDKVDPDKPAAVFRIDEQLKGKTPFTCLAVNLTGDSEGQKEKHTPQLLKRLAPDLPVVMFASKLGKRYIAFCYTNGTWFQLIGQEDGETVRWAFTHCEPYLRRTFKGTTAEMKQAIQDALAGKKPPPEPDPKEPPGLGPEVQPKDPNPKKEKGAAGHVGPIFAVIPTFVVIGPLAVLAAVFPAVFGGLAVFMRRWMVLLSVACTTSTLFAVHLWVRGFYPNSWWVSPAALWGAMTLVTALGAVWSGWRYRAGLQAGQFEARLPSKGEHIVLWSMSAVGLGVVCWGLLAQGVTGLLMSPWKELLVYWVGAWVGALYTLYLRLAPDRGSPTMLALPTEPIILWAMVFATTNLGALEAAGQGRHQPAAFAAGSQSHEEGKPKAIPRGVVWTFEAGAGSIFSSPLVVGDRVYVASANQAGFSTFGTVYCLERDTGKVLWQFNDDGALKQVFSTPCLADGLLYIGEGLHENRGCKFFCLDAADGKKKWEFETNSHTESSPCPADGKVYFGAGDDGIYCLDARDGTKLWQFQDGLHVDASPTVADGRVYVGSGVSRAYKATEILCLDAATGKSIWRVPVELPVWGSPVVMDKQVFFGLGNGNFITSIDPPEKRAGTLLCVEAESGRRVWQHDVRDGVLVRPAVDAHHVWFGSREHHLYCVDRREGRLIRKIDVGSPIVASPCLARCSCCSATTSVFVIGSAGRVCCVDAATGDVQWSYDCGKDSGAKPQLFSSPAILVRRDGEGEARRLFFGAGLTDLTGSSARLYCLEDRVSEGGRKKDE